MNEHKLQDRIIIYAFLLLLLLPILTINRANGVIAKSENRYLAAFPQILNAEGKLADGLKSGLENWLNDNIGFREQFVKLNTNINFRILKRSPSNKVALGRDGWYFYTMDDNLKIAEGTYPLTKDTLEKIKNQQEKLQAYFNKQGIEYVLILPPSKVSIYPEYIKSGNFTSRATPDDIVAAYLKENSTVKVIKLKDELLKAKEQEQVFYKTDTHWNQSGAYVGYQTIINQLNKLGLIHSNPVEVKKVPSTHKGEFAAMMGDVDLLPNEETLNTEIISPHAQKITSGTLFDTIEKIKGNYNIINPSYIYTNPYIHQGKKVLMYGDSMFGYWNMTELLAENFSDFTYIWSYEIQQEIVDAVKPDIVFYDMAERYINQIYTKNIRLINTPLINPQAKIISQNAPTEVNRQDTYTFDITVKNLGDESWSEEKLIRLCIFQDGQDHGYRIPLPAGAEVKPGEEYMFTLSGFGAPSSDTTHLEFQMVQEGINWFGEKERVDIKIK